MPSVTGDPRVTGASAGTGTPDPTYKLESLAVINNASPAFVTHLDSTATGDPVLAAGTYRYIWLFEATATASGGEFRARFQVNTVTAGAALGTGVVLTGIISETGTRGEVVIAGGSTNLRTQFSDIGGGSVNSFRSRVELWGPL